MGKQTVSVSATIDATGTYIEYGNHVMGILHYIRTDVRWGGI